MKKEKFITVMAVLDDNTQEVLECIQSDLERLYGMDTKTKDIPYHITLGSYAVDEKEEIVSRIIDVANKTNSFSIKISGVGDFGNMVRFIKPEISEELLALHMHFDSDYANGFKGWKPHITIYRHSEPTEVELPKHIIDKFEKIKNTKIIEIELGEFFPPKKIIRVWFK